ncbi:MAG: glyoxalase/bleomycin resistance/dioxygenase family protein [Phycisphaerales bacterium]|nr:glyoxalase/bleomycin resistance/dioxygenase family protein [Phycisphaerae bacterium]NNF43388.1 glyoxalase/bleomycin resistance/dioxygenase family protein [Phycisphaerales bacterium]NNM26479.1 glyoxalase/bleomycin resistance/dioxygenase family protein [Phycisphaerales bacterium]
MLDWHDAIGADAAAGVPPAAATPRIRALHLETAASLDAMHAFYHETLGLPVRRRDQRILTIDAGATRLTFERGGDDGRPPFYHFAFNIPENKIREARAWQRERSSIFATPPHQQDPAYPADVRHFAHWNAHAVFFADPAGNVVEYIARHDLTNAASGPFTTRDILYASEIAFVVDDVPAHAASLRAAFDLEQYRGASDAFSAVGDERGLLLVFRRGRNIGVGSGRPYAADVFRTRVEINADANAVLSTDAYPYRVATTA